MDLVVDLEVFTGDNNVAVTNEANKPKRSVVYHHFTTEPNSSKTIFKCNYCSTRLKKDSSGSTGNLMKHIKRFHKNINIGGTNPEPEDPLQKASSEGVLLRTPFPLQVAY